MREIVSYGVGGVRDLLPRSGMREYFESVGYDRDVFTQRKAAVLGGSILTRMLYDLSVTDRPRAEVRERAAQVGSAITVSTDVVDDEIDAPENTYSDKVERIRQFFDHLSRGACEGDDCRTTSKIAKRLHDDAVSLHPGYIATLDRLEQVAIDQIETDDADEQTALALEMGAVCIQICLRAVELANGNQESSQSVKEAVDHYGRYAYLLDQGCEIEEDLAIGQLTCATLRVSDPDDPVERNLVKHQIIDLAQSHRKRGLEALETKREKTLFKGMCSFVALKYTSAEDKLKWSIKRKPAPKFTSLVSR